MAQKREAERKQYRRERGHDRREREILQRGVSAWVEDQVERVNKDCFTENKSVKQALEN